MEEYVVVRRGNWMRKWAIFYDDVNLLKIALMTYYTVNDIVVSKEILTINKY